MPHPIHDDHLVTIKSACRALCVSESTFRRRQGQPDWPRLHRIGRASRVRASEVARCIDLLGAPTRALAREDRLPAGEAAVTAAPSAELACIREAAKVPSGDACPAPWRDATLRPEVDQWQSRLGLSIEEIVGVARGVTRNMAPGALSSPTYLHRAMMRFAASSRPNGNAQR